MPNQAHDVQERLAGGHRRVLENLALGAPLYTVLSELINVVESQADGMLCSVLIVDENLRTISSVVAPHMPQEFVRALEGRAIYAVGGSCGTAALRRESVIVSDTFIDPLWKDYRELAKEFNLRACWSSPVISSQNEVLGTFAMYYSDIREPNNLELQLIQDSTHIAAVALEHSRTRKKLQDTISLLSATIESTADGILVVDRNGKINTFNNKFAEMWRLPKAVLNALDDSKALTFVLDQFSKPEEFLSKILDLYNQPESESFDVLELIDGRVFERYSQPQRMGHAIVGRVWSFRDVTERRKSEVAAETAIHAKTQFIADVSHEIRTPVGAILGFVDLLLEPNQSEADRNRWAMKVADNGAYLLEVVNELLSLARADFGKIYVERREVNFLELINGLADLFQIKAKRKGISLKFVFEGPIPEFIRMDATKLLQILNNIIGNAIKFTSKGFVKVTIKPEPDQISFLVEDTGVGIKPELTGNLFKRFSQADSTIPRLFGGTGLGLALAQRLARALGGDVKLLSSTPGIGCCFRITVRTDAAQVKAVSRPSSTEASKTPRLDGLKVLIVDDSADNQFLAARFLSAAGAKVETANNGTEGVEKALAGHHDVILMDLRMPGKNGYQATEELRSKGVQCPIMALTAQAISSDCEDISKFGFSGYIYKPISRQKLIAAVVQCAMNQSAAG